MVFSFAAQPRRPSKVPWFFYLLFSQIPLILVEHQVLSFSDLLLRIKYVVFAIHLIEFFFSHHKGFCFFHLLGYTIWFHFWEIPFSSYFLEKKWVFSWWGLRFEAKFPSFVVSELVYANGLQEQVFNCSIVRLFAHCLW